MLLTGEAAGLDSHRLDALKERIRNGEHKSHRHRSSPDLLPEMGGLSWMRRSARLIRRMCEAESPIIEPDERIVFTRTTPDVPPLYNGQEWQQLTAGRTLHELGPINNVCAAWGMVLAQGLLERKRVALATRERLAGVASAVEFLDAAVETIDAVLGLAQRYGEAARRAGRFELAEILSRVPAAPARTFHEALQALRLLHGVLWLGGHYQEGLGRFDQYLWPYVAGDLHTGRLTLATAEELVAEFFLSLNKDSDLYPGVQQGDNGQTLMLGGVRRDGTDGVNELTRMVLRAARYTKMIDPKINLRITPQTDLALLELAAELTREGLGFPQYSNDAVVIPALVAHGYELEDARDYTVAACWEFIIPGCGMEVVNIGAVSLPGAVDEAIRQELSADLVHAGADPAVPQSQAVATTSAPDGGFEQILERAGTEIRVQVGRLVQRYSSLLLPPAPYHSVLMDGCLENGRDMSAGLKYNHFGIHGACAADAADALAAVRRFVFEERTMKPEELLRALEANFEGYEALRERLLCQAPKTGNDPEADALVRKLFDLFAEACEAVPDNGRGGKVRPGSGSAMYYMWLAQGAPDGSVSPLGATADGRKRGDFLSANLAPSPQALVRGPISVLQAFSGINYRRVCNGGPITLELAETCFAEPEAVKKCALLVRTFAQIGCQQLQLNALNAQKLREAQRHPERHRHLIVRVWGWSGYFCELAPEYQEHVIARCEHRL